MLKAFVSLKNMLRDSVCLCIPCMSDKFILETDESGAGVGTVLSVRHGEELLPVTFFSKLLLEPNIVILPRSSRAWVYSRRSDTSHSIYIGHTLRW